MVQPSVPPYALSCLLATRMIKRTREVFPSKRPRNLTGLIRLSLNPPVKPECGGYWLSSQRGVFGRVCPAADGSAACPGFLGRGRGRCACRRGVRTGSGLVRPRGRAGRTLADQAASPLRATAARMEEFIGTVPARYAPGVAPH